MDHSPLNAQRGRVAADDHCVQRSRRFLAPLVVAVAMLASCLSPHQSVLDEVNKDRKAYGRAALAYESGYSSKAQAHAERMATQNRLSHSAMSLTAGWCRGGENVGVGSSVAAVQKAFMNSTQHRANILDARFDHAGIGMVERNGRVWVVVQFLDRC